MPHDSIEVIRMHGAKIAFFEEASRGKEFKTAAEEAPFMIRTLGLGPAIATLAAKRGERMKLAVMICRWLADECAHSPWHGTGCQHESWVRTVLGQIAASDRATYRAAQAEAMGYAGWLKKLARAFCQTENG